jgi:hypothetical protein
MQKNISVVLCVVLLGLLVACSSASAATSQEADSVGSQVAGTPAPDSFQVSTLTRLLIGTFQLEDTAQAVTAEQAQALLPLWQAVQGLSQSDTAASAEMTALEQQIQATLTAEQLSTINAMEITPEDMQALMQDLGLTFGNFGDGTPQPGGFTGGNGPPGGGFIGGDGPPGGGFNPQDLSPEQQATLEARRADRAGLGVPAPLLNALIELLEARAA